MHKASCGRTLARKLNTGEEITFLLYNEKYAAHRCKLNNS